MKIGDLIKWVDYKLDIPIEHIGIIVKFEKETDAWLMRDHADWHDLVVLSGGKKQRWTSWQCEVIYESR